MSHKQLRNHKSQENTLVEISRFEPAEGVAEYHVMIHVTQPSLTYQEQLDTLLDTYYQLLENELKGAVAVFKRYFLSDAANQADWLAVQVPESSVCACSIVEQPPLNGTKNSFMGISAIRCAMSCAGKRIVRSVTWGLPPSVGWLGF